MVKPEMAEALICTQNWLKPSFTYFKDLNLMEDFELSEDIIADGVVSVMSSFFWQDIGEKLSEIGSRLDYPHLTKDLAKEIETLWEDAAIQETYARGNELQVPDCTKYFMENLQRLSDANSVPTKEDVLYARVRTTGVVEIQFR
ncbi:Guanine nucleotide-binding protein alpha-2 subunit [Lathyrus oleraceus]|uniref:Guanine nucleotide-binding protein alpha-2 subunit n=1 Tax=Pisum sativum TaxID=3888 RepID=A0A9D5A2G6_PEA|nr:Guanine nucleotide-binding protein alpha-2 subunit [Pisum sativum]